MRAIVCTKYGSPDDLRLEEVERPVPRDSEVLVRVYATSVTFSNLALVTGTPFIIRLSGGLLRPSPRILGSDIAGRVEAVGRSVRRFKPGDEVFGDLADCGRGGFAEYVAAPEAALALKPTNLSFAEAAAVPEAALVALQGLRDAGAIRPGEQVLISGASGGIGTFAVQLARHFGAEVTGVCSTRNVELVRELGADHVIDYTRDDFARNGRQYDLILATAGSRSIFDYRRALRPDGRYVATGGSMRQVFESLLVGPFLSLSGGRRMGGMLVKPNKDLSFVRELIEAGSIRPVIDRQYSLSEVPEALRHYGSGHARGKIVISI